MIDLLKVYVHLQNQTIKYLKTNNMGHLKTNKDKALEAYKNADAKGKQMLIDLYGRENFLVDIKDRVIDYKSACTETGLTPLTLSHFDFLPKEDRERSFARHQVVIGVRALVGDWKPNFKDGKTKYYNYGYENASGLVLVSDWTSNFCCDGSDLLFPTRDLCDHARTIFHKQYLKFIFNS